AAPRGSSAPGRRGRHGRSNRRARAVCPRNARRGRGRRRGSPRCPVRDCPSIQLIPRNDGVNPWESVLQASPSYGISIIRGSSARGRIAAMTDTLTSSTVAPLALERRLATAIPGPRSIELQERRRQVVSDGVSSALPVFIQRAHGAILVDVDGN